MALERYGKTRPLEKPDKKHPLSSPHRQGKEIGWKNNE